MPSYKRYLVPPKVSPCTNPSFILMNLVNKKIIVQPIHHIIISIFAKSSGFSILKNYLKSKYTHLYVKPPNIDTLGRTYIFF